MCTTFERTYSIGALAVSSGDSGIDMGEDGRTLLGGVDSGVGDFTLIRAAITKGTLCGRGEISIESLHGLGEDDSSGGVTILSKQL